MDPRLGGSKPEQMGSQNITQVQASPTINHRSSNLCLSHIRTNLFVLLCQLRLVSADHGSSGRTFPEPTCKILSDGHHEVLIPDGIVHAVLSRGEAHAPIDIHPCSWKMAKRPVKQTRWWTALCSEVPQDAADVLQVTRHELRSDVL